MNVPSLHLSQVACLHSAVKVSVILKIFEKQNCSFNNVFNDNVNVY